MNKKMVILSIIILAIDQIAKAIVEVSHVSMTLIKDFLYLTYVQNTGAAWSFLSGHITLIIVITIALLVFIYNMTFSYEENKFNNWAFGLLFGGIIGNFADRIFMGCVRDFIDIHIFGYHFPIFNVADMAIVIGVVMLIISTFKGEWKNGNRSKRKSTKN